MVWQDASGGKDPTNERLEETFRLIALDASKYKDVEAVAQAADNIGRSDVATWIRSNPWKFHLWVQMYAAAYTTPEVEDQWE
jgi:hypothetical protein